VALLQIVIVTSGKLLHCSIPQITPLKNEDNSLSLPQSCIMMVKYVGYKAVMEATDISDRGKLEKIT